MTWYLLLMWCAGFGASSCTTTIIPSGYTDKAECIASGERNVKEQKLEAYRCVVR